MKRSELPETGNAVVGCYSVDVYCSLPYTEHLEYPAPAGQADMAMFTGETRAGCLRAARSSGWWISRDEKRALCPYHAKQVPR